MRLNKNLKNFLTSLNFGSGSEEILLSKGRGASFYFQNKLSRLDLDQPGFRSNKIIVIFFSDNYELAKGIIPRTFLFKLE